MNYRLSEAADKDLEACLEWSFSEFGRDAAVRYARLMEQALRDLVEQSDRAGVQYRTEFGFHFYHLRHSRNRVTDKQIGKVKKPRHFLVFRIGDNVLEIVRILHDSMDFESHLD